MKIIVFAYAILLPLFIKSQINCYSVVKYEEVNTNLKVMEFVQKKGDIGLCYSANFAAIRIGENITSLPVMKESVSNRNTSDGYRVYSFMTDASGNYKRGEWNIEISFEKTRKVVLNNTISGMVYIMSFPNSTYMKSPLKMDIDSASIKKAALPEGYYYCKFCDGAASTYKKTNMQIWYTEIYCGKCKKDTNGVNMYDIWSSDYEYKCESCSYSYMFKFNKMPERCPKCLKRTTKNCIKYPYW